MSEQTHLYTAMSEYMGVGVLEIRDEADLPEAPGHGAMHRAAGSFLPDGLQAGVSSQSHG